MSDDPQNKPEPTGTPAEPMVQISEAELEKVKARAQQYDDFEQEGKDLGMPVGDDYHDWLVTKKAEEVEKVTTGQPQPVTQPTAQPVTQPAAQPVAAQSKETLSEIQELRAVVSDITEDLRKSKTMSSAAFLEAQFSQYDNEQKALPEDQRYKHTKEDIYALVSDRIKGTMVRELATREKSNLCMAASEILTIEKELEARKKGTAPTAPAAVAAIQIGEGMPPKPEPKEGERSPNEVSADEICPDDEFVLLT